MKKIKNIIVILLVAISCIFCFAGCSEEVHEEIRLAMYETLFDGTEINQYPKYVFTDIEILEKIVSATGTGAFETDEGVYVSYRFKYYNEQNNEVIINVESNGKVTFMSMGLPQSKYYFTAEEYKDFEALIQKQIQAQ